VFLHTILECWETEHRGVEVVSWKGSARASEREPASLLVSFTIVALRLMSTSCIVKHADLNLDLRMAGTKSVLP
jgi:hypothetical protein